MGLVLLLALVVTYYAHELQAGVPARGREAELEWHQRLEEDLREAAARMATGTPGTVTLEGPLEPEPVVVPLVGSARATPAAATLRTEPGCTTLTAIHILDNRTVVDLNATPVACLVVEAGGSYTDAVRYVVELGALLRIDGERAVILAGPPLDLARDGGGGIHATLGIPLLEAPAEAAALPHAGAQLQLVALGGAGDAPSGLNADNLTWQIETRHPAAWEAWLRQQARAAGLAPAEHVVSCDLSGCGVGLEGRGNVTFTLHGPSTTGGERDVAVSLPVQRLALRPR